MSSHHEQSASLFVLGATHHRAPLEIREKLSLTDDDIGHLHDKLSSIGSLREFSILNTCNRIEFHGVASDQLAVTHVQRIFCEHRNFPETDFENFALRMRDLDAIRHLLEVASGLDSQLLGETEIFGQLKDAYARAQQRRSAGPVLNRVFQKTFNAAKHVRTHTAINSGQVSIANVSVDLAQTIFGQLKDTRILLVGAGEIGEKTARAFQSRGAASLTVASRHLERAMALASSLDATALPYELCERHLADFDIVVCCTAAPGSVITKSAVTAAMKARTARPLFFIDLAMPRDVESAVGELANTYLYNLDDLAAIAEENRAAREAEVTKCRQLIAERAQTLWRQAAARLQSPT